MARILIVDDEPTNRALIRALLSGTGYELFDASSAEEALALEGTTRPDLVLLDVLMPGIGGYAALTELKQRARGRGEFLPVLLVTSLDDRASRHRGLELGADDFVTKPLDAVGLGHRLRNLLALRADRAALQARHAKIVQLQRFKDEMAALVVHDLRNPASAVLANIEFLAQDPTFNSTPLHAEVISDAYDGAQRLLRLLANLLDVARAEDHRIEPHRTNVALAALVEPIVHQRQVSARGRSVRLVTEIDRSLEVPIDPDLVARVIENVLDNALRYTPRGGTISLIARLDGAHLQIRIGNSGIPIPVASRTALFEKYSEVTGTAPSHRNSGLGLYFCRIAAEAHGGQIWIEEETALPTVFVVSLPIAERSVVQ